ncbi:hypothetical protein PLEOSDRAFT_163637 [Pleurotus ostreatus PC15]|uniref:RNase III domain-containing protein n=2 Tax=Pleurotus TaxID=5320 RepID=A0A067NG54_PLEO1|nr:hypothetical protein CCMSSC00406_0003015 [Pleurotus cornucopiae]KDQ22746.1 hypothetical protein PLEOSDRAFT_163637 [Pleurotus ostreatus PC15]
MMVDRETRRRRPYEPASPTLHSAISKYDSKLKQLANTPRLPDRVTAYLYKCLPTGAVGNNQVIEFRGDADINLLSSLAVKDALDAMKGAVDPRCHEITTRILSSNDILGRIAYAMELHKDLNFKTDSKDVGQLAYWSLYHRPPPPKVYADLFEVHIAGRVDYFGLERTVVWFGSLMQMLMPAALADFMTTPQLRLTSSTFHEEDYVFYPANYANAILEGIRSLDVPTTPLQLFPSTVIHFVGQIPGVADLPHLSNIEIGTRLLHFYCAHITLFFWPGYYRALSGGCGLLTGIAKGLLNDLCLRAIAKRCRITLNISTQRDRHNIAACEVALALRAVVGNAYTRRGAGIHEDAIYFFAFFVVCIHDALIRCSPWLRPILTPRHQFNKVTWPMKSATESTSLDAFRAKCNVIPTLCPGVIELRNILCLTPSHVTGKRKKAQQDTSGEAGTSVSGGTHTIIPLKETKRRRLGPEETQGDANSSTSSGVQATSAVEKSESRCLGPSLLLLRPPQEGKENYDPHDGSPGNSRSHLTRQPLVSPLSLLGRLVPSCEHDSEARKNIPCTSGAKQLRSTCPASINTAHSGDLSMPPESCVSQVSRGQVSVTLPAVLQASGSSPSLHSSGTLPQDADLPTMLETKRSESSFQSALDTSTLPPRFRRFRSACYNSLILEDAPVL